MAKRLNHGALCLVACLLAAIAGGCKGDDPIRVAEVNASRMPTMTTRNVVTIISDSGVPQYRMVCPLWRVYDNIDTPVWILSGGPYLEKFDPKYNIVFTVAADSAVNDRLTQRWHLYGNVEFKQEPGVLLLTQYLVWDQRDQTISSDSFIHIEQPGKVVEGVGFLGRTSSRGDLTSYVLHNPRGVLPYSRQAMMGAGAPGGAPASLPPGVTPAQVQAYQNAQHP